MDIKALVELQTAYSLSAWHLNRALVSLILSIQNENETPVSAFDRSLERVKETRGILNRVQTWIVDNAPESEQV